MKWSDKPPDVPEKLWGAKMALNPGWGSDEDELLLTQHALEYIVDYLIEEHGVLTGSVESIVEHLIEKNQSSTGSAKSE